MSALSLASQSQPFITPCVPNCLPTLRGCLQVVPALVSSADSSPIPGMPGEARLRDETPLACSILPAAENQCSWDTQPQRTALSHVTPLHPPGCPGTLPAPSSAASSRGCLLPDFQDKAPSRVKWKPQETILGKISESKMKSALQRKASLVTHVPKNIPCRTGSRSCQKARKPNLPQATLGPVGPQTVSHALATNSQ